jgi:hypothetical protein
VKFCAVNSDVNRELSASSLARLASTQLAHPCSSLREIELNGVLSSAHKFADGELLSI